MSQNQWHIIYLGVIVVGIYLVYTIAKPVAQAATNTINNANSALQSFNNFGNNVLQYGQDALDSMAATGPLSQEQ